MAEETKAKYDEEFEAQVTGETNQNDTVEACDPIGDVTATIDYTG